MAPGGADAVSNVSSSPVVRGPSASSAWARDFFRSFGCPGLTLTLDQLWVPHGRGLSGVSATCFDLTLFTFGASLFQAMVGSYGGRRLAVPAVSLLQIADPDASKGKIATVVVRKCP